MKKMEYSSGVGKTDKCWTTHPVYEINGLPILGGSCTANYPEEVDVFIGLDRGMREGSRGLPWNAGHDVHFAFPDGGVPKDVKEFRNLLDWTLGQMRDGKGVYVGCIGGHGRTGLFLSALTTVATLGDPEPIYDSITRVREKYCKNAVETKKQVDWLAKHFGIKKVEPSKSVYTFNKKGWKKASKSSSRGSLWDDDLFRDGPMTYSPMDGYSRFIFDK